MTRKEKKAKGSKSVATKKNSIAVVVRDNVEAVAVAIVLALIIRHFCVEAFKIPTGSMKPTLYGNELEKGRPKSGDRILVFKPSYITGKPKRWDIIVFRYPLNSSINYIKRCIGLPGEQLEIRHGDIFIDGEIARKPRSLQKHLWKNWPVYPRPSQEGVPLEEFWKQEPSGSFVRQGSVVMAESETEAALRYPAPITVGGTASRLASRTLRYATGSETPVGDVLLEYRARMESEGTVLFAEIRESGHLFRLEIPEGSVPRILHHEVTATRSPEPMEFQELGVAEGPTFRVGESNKVEFYLLDGSIQLDMNGKSRLNVDFPIDQSRRNRNHIRFGIERGSAAFSSVHVYRDIYHLSHGSTSVTIPEDHYYALGDNTAESKDSRLWKRTLIVDDRGREIYFDEEDTNKVSRMGNAITFPDIFGQMHTVRDYQQKMTIKQEHAPFIPEEYIVGNAFSTFWPLTRGGGLNLKFVH